MTVKDFYKNYDYNARAPYFVKQEELTEEQWRKLTESDTFCMLPWMHFHAFPDGRAYPCCLGEAEYPVGSVREQTMREIWNDEPMREMRKNMLADRPCRECTRCYEQEASGFFSGRRSANKHHGHHIKKLGSNPFELTYWDIRFSNLCNLR